MTPSHLDTVETAKPRRTFHDTAEAFHVTVETFYDTFKFKFNFYDTAWRKV